jgi:hypothetical protein
LAIRLGAAAPLVADSQKSFLEKHGEGEEEGRGIHCRLLAPHLAKKEKTHEE